VHTLKNIKSDLLVKRPIHKADEGENRYVANQATIGINPVTSTAIAEDNAHPRYIDVA
jgi:hypothetical protein